jgi:histone deacetylase 11
MRIVYSPHYNIGGYGIEKLHPFDGRKYAKAWAAICEAAPQAAELLIEPDGPATRETIERVHQADYLQRLGTAKYLAEVFETPVAKWIPAAILDSVVLEPMRYATQGTVLAARAALDHGLAINLGGGYHHAKPTSGEGFNVYNDVAIAVADLRATGRLSADDTMLYVDCDAHHGNGISHCFLQDRTFKTFDICNAQIYPRHDRPARERIDHAIRLCIGTDGESYLLELERALPAWIERMFEAAAPKLAIYNAGTDVIAGDALGALGLMPAHVLERDVFVIDALRKRGIPTMMVLGGGYTTESYRLVADSVIALVKRFA